MIAVNQSASETKQQRAQPIVVPLFLALIVHTLLLISLSTAVPTKPTKKEKSRKLLSVQLQQPPIINNSTKAIVENIAVEEPPLAKDLTTPAKIAPKVENQLVEEGRSAGEEISSSLILQQAAEQTSLMLQQSSQQNLGKFVAHKLPENWTRTAVAYNPGIFRSAELPLKSVVLDSWKSVNGTSNVRTKLPNGDIICSSREQQNPLDLYSMPIWMHKSC